MDLSTLTAAQESIKALFQLARVATAAAVDHEVKERLIAIQGAILETQAKLGDAQEERLTLLQQVADLKDQIRRYETAQAALDAYELYAIDDGKFLYRFKQDAEGAVSHFACPTCHNSGKVTVLQSRKSGSRQTFYWCQTCKFQLTVGPSDPLKLPRRTSYY